MPSKCLNCGSEKTQTLRATTSEQKFAPMSDGNLLSHFDAAQLLCHSCGCIFTEYYPEDRLQRYFKEEYDVSDTVQNCQVVINDEKKPKHSIIHTNLLNESKNLSASGNMLEIACGEGDLSRKFAELHAQWNCTGIDPSLNANLTAEADNIEFIRNFFSAEIFGNKKFDAIIAHGILNRVPTIKMLEGISKIANPGALISVEVVLIEDSMYSPFIWDHSYTYLKERFTDYLKSFGIVPFKEYDCGSTIQLVCQYNPETANKDLLVASHETVQKTLHQYESHLKTWEQISAKFNESVKKGNNSKIAIFGAGLYSAVLYHLIDHSKIDYVVDEFRAGQKFDSHKVIDLESGLDTSNTVFLLCCRERNISYINEKISKLGFDVINLH